MSAVIKLSSPATKQFWEIAVLFEDEHLLALDKPSSLLTSPDRYDAERPNLMRLLPREIGRNAAWAQQRQISYLANAHRLDFETSGVLLLAKSKTVLIELANQFGSAKPDKTYLALVHGLPSEPMFDVNAALAPHPIKPGISRVDPKGGKKAATKFEVLQRFARYTFLKCQPLTGRTHQIRVHLRDAGFPIVGDQKYGGMPLLLSRLKKDYRLKPNATERPLIGRVALHAASLQILHPIKRCALVIEAPLPKDMTVALKYLRKFGAT
jgi:23S rRNA pseudouridine1911/1915/1917 synthase